MVLSNSTRKSSGKSSRIYGSISLASSTEFGIP
jgi:hypothetical protein